MIFKSLLMLAICFAGYSSAEFLQGNDDRTFQIKSIPVRPEPYGYVHHHGIYSDMDLLEFSASLSPADFRFTSAKALQEVSTGKCVARKTAYNRQLILRSCAAEYVDAWYYNATSQLLVDTTVKMCFSPWQNSLPPYDISLLTGLSPCDGWNTVALVYDSSERNSNKVKVK